MSYEGYTEFLSKDGEYLVVGCWDDDPKGMAYRHSVDQTNGYEEDN